VGHPGAQRADEPAAAPPDGQLERPQRGLHLERTAAQQDRVSAPCARDGHAAKVLPTPLHPIPPVTKWSQDVTSFFTNHRFCRVILKAMNESSRADLHVHSSASAVSKLKVQRSLSIPKCATDPLEVYELAKARGMDFVTIT